MQSSGLCEGPDRALEGWLAGRVRSLAGQAAGRGEDERQGRRLEGVARQFAGILYIQLVRQMQRTVRADEDEDRCSPISEGALDFLDMFLPQAIADEQGDPVARYIHQQLDARCGEMADESA